MMAKKNPSSVEFSVTEYSVRFDQSKQSYLKLRVDGQELKIPVAPETRAYFQKEFVRENPSKLQREKYTTVMKLMVAAYKQGVVDAGK